jgi:carbamoyltransferase
MLVLGFHSYSPVREFEEMDIAWGSHDAAAVLLENGKVLAAIEEERLSRVKHSSAFPARAIRRCLELAGVELHQIDWIAVGGSEPMVDHFFLHRSLEDATFPFGSGRQQIASLFAREFGVDVSSRLRFVGHHVAHLWSAFLPSGLDSGLVMSVDGIGDGLSGAVATFEGAQMQLLREYSHKRSLGHFYRDGITLLGYTRFDEYKVMGLAPYGNPSTYADLFARVYRLLPDGEYELQRRELVRAAGPAGLLAHVRRKGEPFTQAHADFAAGLQETLGRVVIHVLTHLRKTTGARNLCLAGGVAHNCTLNGHVAYSELFDEVWVQPAAHDAGNALGAALAVLDAEGVRYEGGRMSHVFFGTGLPGDAELERAVSRWGDLISFQRSADIVEETASALAGGAVVGWVQGRSEFGPRALGNRSILADPRPAENKDRINAMVKKREGYRPFAPSVQVEKAADYFELPRGMKEAPFMTFALRVRPNAQPMLGAITHVDGTARVQTVAREANPRYWSLLDAFERHAGIPILLNTSFNNNAEPIVDSVDEAISCFLTTGLDLLVVGDFVVRKRDDRSDPGACHGLVPSIAPTHKLVAQARPDGTRAHSIESTANRYFTTKTVPLTDDAYAVLHAADGVATIDDLLSRSGITSADRMQSVSSELWDLWSRRVIVLRPSGPPA